MLRSSSCDYADAYILVKGKIKFIGPGDHVAARPPDERNKCVIFKSCAPFIEWISKINDTEKYNVQNIDTAMPTYNLIE